jgi:protein-tyrosine phosphatase
MDQLREMAARIAEHVQDGDVNVHGKIGYSRSAAAVGAYLLSSGQVRDAAEAIERLRAAR